MLWTELPIFQRKTELKETTQTDKINMDKVKKYESIKYPISQKELV